MSDTLAQTNRFTTTVARELAIAVSGTVMVLFILGHLAGNMLLYAGPEAFNGYAESWQASGPGLWLIRLGMITFALLHVSLTVWTYLKNRRSGDQRYQVQAYLGRKTVATRLMIFSGIFILAFLFLHLSNFTLGDKTGPASVVEGLNDGESLGLYGLVWNSFGNPLLALVYVIAVSAVGLHLSHAVSSVLVTLGILADRNTSKAELVAKALGVIVAVGFSSIPIYVLVRTYVTGV